MSYGGGGALMNAKKVAELYRQLADEFDAMARNDAPRTIRLFSRLGPKRDHGTT